MAFDMTTDTAVRDDAHASRHSLLDASRVYVCTDARREQDDLEAFLDAAYSGGVDIIQLRDKGLEARAEIAALHVLKEVAHRHGKLFSVNDRADVALLVGADVFHVGQGDLSSAQARAVLGPDVILGVSTHSAEQAAAAEADPEIDYYCVGPVWETPTKPGRPAVGTELLSAVAAKATKPWFAIGGIAPGTRLAEAARGGAERIVVVRAVTDAVDPAAAARRLRGELTMPTTGDTNAVTTEAAALATQSEA